MQCYFFILHLLPNSLAIIRLPKGIPQIPQSVSLVKNKCARLLRLYALIIALSPCYVKYLFFINNYDLRYFCCLDILAHFIRFGGEFSMFDFAFVIYACTAKHPCESYPIKAINPPLYI